MTSTSPSPPLQTILQCSDSPLSMSASILSILTFFLGVAASYIALQSATRGAPSEITRLVDELRSTQSEINRVAGYIFDDTHYGPIKPPPAATGTDLYGKSHAYATGVAKISSGGTHYVPTNDGSHVLSGIDTLWTETQTLLSSCIRLFYETDRLLKRSNSDSSRWDPDGLRRRIVFVMNRHKVDEKIQRLAEQKQKLASVQMSLFMRKSTAQDALLADMLMKLEKMEEMRKRRSQ
ncbi:uncharacterized protein KY384_001944 [Bacidia gigantensis]|uniref:uncharacterized protein n=1 Tax=Bacidia gigantensis TaxID=2732470 RepID=UPI001D044745|nr:uncharacterized protein KY384_001944 [Bacidia gigantensis]KAG8533161.1 hypothetical protein KY384_001944 [Bacidia gigantensis]